MTQRRWIADTWNASTATLLGAQALHLARVLRGAPGQRAHIVAGTQVWDAVIAHIADSKDEVVFTLEHPLDAAEPPSLSLLLAVFKFDRMEWAIEKATELGVTSIAPVITRRTEKHLAQAAEKRQDRWQRIALEAAKQSRRASVPVFTPVRALRPALDGMQCGTRILLSEQEHTLPLATALQGDVHEAWLAVGPEGGWSTDELELFASHSWTTVTLGSHILRAETAAVAALAVAASILGEPSPTPAPTQ